MPWAGPMKTKASSGLRTVILVVAGLVIVGLVWAGISLFSSLDQQVTQARAVADKVVAAVSTDWGRTSFDPLATPEFVAAHAKGQYDGARYLQILGALQKNRLPGRGNASRELERLEPLEMPRHVRER